MSRDLVAEGGGRCGLLSRRLGKRRGRGVPSCSRKARGLGGRRQSQRALQCGILERGGRNEPRSGPWLSGSLAGPGGGGRFGGDMQGVWVCGWFVPPAQEMLYGRWRSVGWPGGRFSPCALSGWLLVSSARKRRRVPELGDALASSRCAGLGASRPVPGWISWACLPPPYLSLKIEAEGESYGDLLEAYPSLLKWRLDFSSLGLAKLLEPSLPLQLPVGAPCTCTETLSPGAPCSSQTGFLRREKTRSDL